MLCYAMIPYLVFSLFSMIKYGSAAEMLMTTTTAGVSVTVKATSGHYEGLFMLARSGDDKKKAYGTFRPDNSKQFKTVSCYQQTKVRLQ